MADGWVWLAYLAGYGAIFAYTVGLISRFRRAGR